MPLSAAERKRRQREKDRALGVQEFRMNLAHSEREAIARGASAQGFEDQTEYVMMLVYKDAKARAVKAGRCPDCSGLGCFTCCDSMAEIKALRDG